MNSVEEIANIKEDIPDIMKMFLNLHYEEIANTKEDIQDIRKMFLTLHNNFKNYIDFDSSAIKEGKFQPSYEFEVILSQSTTYLKRAMNFDQIQDVAATLFNRISNETKYEGDENDKLYKLLSKITLIAQLFVTQVFGQIIWSE